MRTVPNTIDRLFRNRIPTTPASGTYPYGQEHFFDESLRRASILYDGCFSLTYPVVGYFRVDEGRIPCPLFLPVVGYYRCLPSLLIFSGACVVNGQGHIHHVEMDELGIPTGVSLKSFANQSDGHKYPVSVAFLGVLEDSPRVDRTRDVVLLNTEFGGREGTVFWSNDAQGGPFRLTYTELHG